jgi:hypothetical protein
MLTNVNHSIGCTIQATDGEIGKVAEFYFDDLNWTIRYLVVNTGNWLAERLVLISPISVRKTEWEARRLDVQLTKSQVENSPDIDTQDTVSRQHEAEYSLYYGYPSYWDGPYLWGRAQQPAALINASDIAAVPTSRSVESHLRGTNAMKGYHIDGVDGQVGHIEDFILDDETWAIRYLVVNTSNWGLGQKVLLAPQWIERVSWADSQLHVGLSLSTIENSPEYNQSVAITRDYEYRLYEHYRRSGYWLSMVS